VTIVEENVPEPIAGVLRISRERSRWQDRARSYQIIVDGQIVSEIANGAACELKIPPGTHTVQVKIDWTGSPTETFTLTPGQVVEFTCRAAVRPYQLWALVRSMRDRSGWIRLERASDP
jgi:hypothetical protein